MARRVGLRFNASSSDRINAARRAPAGGTNRSEGLHPAGSTNPGTCPTPASVGASPAATYRSALVGQAATHAGCRPASTRVAHRWHFDMTPFARSYCGVPNGQVISQ